MSAFVIGNPGQPSFATKSTLLPTSKKVSFRVAYLDDYVYAQHFSGEFSIASLNEKPAVVKMSTNAASLTMNFIRRLDVYGIIGNAQIQMDEEVYSQQRLAWGVGGKWVIYTWDKFQVGCDFKYFETSQKPSFLVSSGLALNLATDLQLEYTEYQGAIGFSYRSQWICPYLMATYLDASIHPKPPLFLVQVPGRSDLMDASINSLINKDRWGAAIGATLIMGSKGTLAVESRFINQNAINATLELRF